MKTALSCVAVVASLLTASTAAAQDAPEIAWNLGATSDYVFRGYSQTNKDPAVFGGVDLSIRSVYAGAWASNVDFGDETDAEVDLYGGYRAEIAGFAVDVGGVGYFYVSQPAGADYDYAELKVAAARAFGPVTVGAAAYWSPDFFGADDQATYVEANASFSLARRWTLTGSVGHQSLNVNADYASWNAGVAYAVTDNVAIDLRYHDTDVIGPLSADRVVTTLQLWF